jgi:hypothetical protein
MIDVTGLQVGLCAFWGALGRAVNPHPISSPSATEFQEAP